MMSIQPNPIDKKNVQDIISLTPLQEGMLFDYLKNPEKKHYYEQLVLHLSGEINLDLLQAALNHVIQGNEMLRTIYRWDKLNKPMQIVLKSYQVPLKVYDLSSVSPVAVREERLREVLAQDRQEQLNLQVAPLRIKVILLAPERAIMVITNHHILYDGWSNGIILQEFFTAYQQLATGQVVVQPEKHSFKEFVKWLQAQSQVEARDYWTRYLAGFESRTLLPTLPEQSQGLGAGQGELVETGVYMTQLSTELVREIDHFLTEHRLTLATLFYGAWGLLLQRYANTEDVVFGTTVSGRNADLPGLEEMVGLFINTIPLRVQGKGAEQTLAFLKRIEESLRDRSKYEHLSLIDIKGYSELAANEELFESIVAIENYPLDEKLQEVSPLLQVDSFEMNESTNLDLTLAVELRQGIRLQFGYRTGRFAREMVVRLAGHLAQVLQSLVTQSAATIAEVELLSPAEREQLVVEWNQTTVDYPKERTMVQVFADYVESQPDKVAVVYKDQQLTYRELNWRAECVARHLQTMGVGEDILVGIMADKSLEMMVGILGILKAGGAYLPIEPEYPVERIQYMLTDGAVQILLTPSPLPANLSFQGQVLDLTDHRLYQLDSASLEEVGSAREKLSSGNNPDRLAYVIYTSGSTGQPKGVMISQRNVLRLVKNPDYVQFDLGDRVLQMGTLAFDASTFEVWGALLNGLELHLGAKELVLRPEELASYIREKGITTILLTTPLFHVLAEEAPELFQPLKYLLVGGDVLSPVQVQRVRQLCPEVQLINAYGPTENTTISTTYRVDREWSGNVPIGRPISNSTAYVLDAEQRLCPLGVYGELWVGGAGLARGYWNRPELTAEKFVPHPFISGERLYRTGDLARWLPDGNLQFNGRIDQQVKIRGYRIELGEIEQTLLKLAGVREAVVLSREDGTGQQVLCSYLITDPTQPLDSQTIHDWLVSRLPDYMIPADFIQLDQFPLTKNGKIDRKALPQPAAGLGKQVEYLPPQDALEEKLAMIWSDLLGIDREMVGRQAHFFELGGHSLKATSLASRIHKELDVEVGVGEVFQHPTLQELAAVIRGKEENLYTAIQPVGEKVNYQTSSAQKRMYMLQKLEPEQTTYNIPAVFEVKGELDQGKLDATISKLIRRHEILRTSFVTIEGEIRQQVAPELEFEIEYLERSELGEGTTIRQQIREEVAAFVRPFELQTLPLFRMRVVRLADQRAILLFDIHHIIFDGASMEIWVQELVELYQGKELPELRIQYKDYAAWQNQLLESEFLQEQEEYWLAQFADELPILHLPTDYPRPAIQSMAGEQIRFSLDEKVTRQLKRLATQTGSSLYMILLAGLNILLAKYSGQDDLIIGSPIAGRPHADLEKLVGMFVNTLALRNQPKGELTLQDFLQKVQETALQAYAHQDYQFEELVEQLNLKRDLSRNPLFDVMFGMQNMEQGSFELGDVQLVPYEAEQLTAKFDLIWLAEEGGEEIRWSVDYSTALFKRSSVERMVGHLQTVLQVISTADVTTRLAEISLVSAREKATLLQEFNQTQAPYPQDQTLHQLFERQAKQRPEAVALRCAGQTLTYRELNQRANSLARRLRAEGVQPEELVGIMAERSLEMFIGLVAILKSGGAYLPIDPAYPADRIQYMLADSQAQVLLVSGDGAGQIEFDGQLIQLDDQRLYQGEGSNLPRVTKSTNLAYLIYTSGSTGKPKGVMVEHHSVLNKLHWRQQKYPLSAEDVILQKTAFTFDVSVWELFWWMLAGASLCLLPPGGEKEPETIVQTVQANQVTVIHFVPSMLTIFLTYLEQRGLDGLQSLRRVFASGEALQVQQVEEFYRHFDPAQGWNTTLHNLYGPTEATIEVTYFDCLPEQKLATIPIGRPIANTRLYILDQAGQVQPIGVPGELCIAGVNLARGYLNRPELTAEKFVWQQGLRLVGESGADLVGEVAIDPTDSSRGERIYRTGDLARWLPDGNIQYLGRLDHQVKIRGYRIELGEIEKQLLQHPAVREAVVLDRLGEDGLPYLAAYLVGSQGLTVSEYREYLATSLPEYMIPSYFVELEKMPLNTSGKIDRKALPAPTGDLAVGTPYQAPRTETEEGLVELWQEVLKVERIGINDNYFELGGHSLKGNLLLGKVAQRFEIEMPLKELFQHPTVAAMAEYVEQAKQTDYQQIPRVAEQREYLASSAQKRMYLLQQLDRESTGYNLPAVFEVLGELSLERMNVAFTQLIQRHESLRTTFATRGEEIIQQVQEKVAWQVELWAQPGPDVDQAKLDEWLKDFVRPFELDQAPLFRVGLVRLAAERSLLIFDIHHIIADGLSLGILIREFGLLYQGEELLPLQIQYKDYAEWQQKQLSSGQLQEQGAYWSQQLGGEIPVLQLPTDFPRPPVQSFAGESLQFTLDQELTRGLKELATATGSTLYMVLVAGIQILLAKYSGQAEIIIGSPIAGRSHVEVEPLIGMFVNTLAMRNRPERQKSYLTFLQEVQRTTLEAFEHQEYPFEELVERLELRRDLSRNPLFDVMFTLQNMDDAQLELEQLCFKPYRLENRTAKFDLNLTAQEQAGEIVFAVDYARKLFKPETVQRMMGHLVNILKVVVADTEITLGEIPILTPEEERQLLWEFNGQRVDFPRELTIQQVFARQVEEHPEELAVVYQADQLSYRELDLRSNRLARRLREQGVQAEQIVGICVGRSVEMIVGILAVLKAGGAYLPIGTNYPTERVQYLLEHSQAEILLTEGQELAEEILACGVTVLNLRDQELYTGEETKVPLINQPEDLAYALYTSGSTGNPKGVMIEHRSVLNLVAGLAQIVYQRYAGRLNVALVAPYYFDASVQQIFAALLQGHTLRIVPEDVRLDGQRLLGFYQEQGIDISDGTPTHLSLLTNAIPPVSGSAARRSRVKHFIIGGDIMSSQVVADLLARFADHKPTLTNIYGLTECCVDTTAYLIEPERFQPISSIPIGSTLANQAVYILGQEQELLPIGVIGELYIGGEGVGRGYLNNPALTAERFIANPFKPGEKIYRTGDLARWLPDGNIEFLGRMDHQVKIRGYRIELGEVEGQLLTHPALDEAIVLARDDQQGSKYLCAYLVATQEVTVGELREYLLQKLPEYMVPAFFILLDQLPLTASGKIDRQALPEPDGTFLTGREYQEPETELEAKLVAIWKEVLGFDQIGTGDHFFELGGHSLKATLLAGKIHQELEVEVPLKVIFSHPTIRGLAQYLEQADQSQHVAIERTEKKANYLTSSAQKRMYLLQQMERESIGYNMPGLLELKGAVNLDRLEAAFRALIDRHETLRTSFAMVEGEIVQRVHPTVEFAVQVRYGDVATHGTRASIDELATQLVTEFVQPFELSQAPLFRVQVVRWADDHAWLIFDLHHIISDGISMENLVREFGLFYQGETLAELRIQYRDYAEWQRRRLSSDLLQQQKEYWLEELQGELPVLNLPTDYPRPQVQSLAGARHTLSIDPELTIELKQLAHKTGTTLYMVLLSAVNILLAKYSGQEDLIIGTPIAGRAHVDLQDLIGVFVNTLALRNRPQGGKRYLDFLQEVKEGTLLAYQNQDYQFEELVDELQIKRNLSRNPLFDVLLNLQSAPFTGVSLDELQILPVELKTNQAKFDLTLTVLEQVDRLEIELVYAQELFQGETIAQLAQHLVVILHEVTQRPEQTLAEIDILTEQERQLLVEEWNQTVVPYPQEQTLHQIFEAQVALQPEATALIYQGRELSYRELNQRGNGLARVLRAKGVGPDTVVALKVERSLEMMIGILGILKAGGAYLPILPDYPPQRIQELLDDSQAQLMLTTPDGAVSSTVGSSSDTDTTSEYGVEQIDLTDPTLYQGDLTNLPLVNQPADLAYVLYTSGSTGKPKGVMVEHGSVINTVSHLQRNYPLEKEDCLLQSTIFVFDASVREIFWWYFNGASCCLLGQDEEKDPGQIVATIAKYGITHVKFVPMILHEILNTVQRVGVEKLTSLRYLLVGGEALPGEVVKKYFELMPQETLFCNMYGPTEATLHCTELVLTAPIKEAYAPIGRAISNDQIYVLDQHLKPVPIGVTGEIYIGGIGVARGYLNRPELTAERFVPNPFRPGERMYKTGDLGRWLRNGVVEFQGRIDHQVKIRGFRIELGEIENHLLQYPGVTEAVVVDRVDQQDRQGARYLCAYLVSAEAEVDLATLKEFLTERLPHYMIPIQYVFLGALPQTTSGKVDRKALPEPEGRVVTGSTYQPPTNSVETGLVEIWQGLLGVEQVGIADDFFELGGHSFKVISMGMMVEERWQVELPLRVVFQQPTIRELAKYIQSAGKKTQPTILKAEPRDAYPVSAAQKRFYVLHQLEDVHTVYNMPHALLVQGELDLARLELAYQQLIQRHAALRTSFEMRGGEPVQVVHLEVEGVIETVQVEDQLVDQLLAELVQPFDLSKAPLLRVALVQTPTRQILFFDSNHILLDGVSVEVFLQELMELYTGKELEPPTLQYQDFVLWQEELFASGQMQGQEEYWLETLAGPLPGLNLPTDYHRPAVESFQGDQVMVNFDQQMSAEIHQFIKEESVTLYVFLLAAYNILLAKYTQQEDLVVGTVTAGRTHPALERTVGMFINTLPMRNYPEGEKSFAQFLQEVKMTTFQMYENQAYPFEMMVKNLGLHWAPGQNPLLQTLFFSPTFGDFRGLFDKFQLEPYGVAKPTARFDLLAFINPEVTEVSLLFEYKRSLFKRSTIEEMGEHYQEIVAQVMARPEMRLEEICLSKQIHMAEETVMDDGDFGF